MDDNLIIYRINNDDIIYSIEGAWDKFALENDGLPDNKSTNILGNPLWRYIKDFETKHIYKLIIDHVRLLKKEITIPIMCDGPDTKRFLDLTIIPLDNGKIEFQSLIKKEVKRKPVSILKKIVKREGNFLKMCSYCKTIKVDETTWMETAKAVKYLKIFNKPVLPHISHGICPDCYNNIMKELESYKIAFNK
ncbi:MAG: hypothetical protein N2202_04480 [Proteobacteria bacterium]|nr:hypothetical protein [Pseudomonadota bacterium]